MTSLNNNSFFHGWQKFAVIAIGIMEVIIVIIFILTELGNVASNFWLTNVFAGSWCGLLLLTHAVTLFVIGCCLSGPTAAFRAVIITIITLLACVLLISFNAVFIAQPSTCILTSSCTNNSVSTTIFSYNYSQKFFTTFNSLGAFKTYTLSQSKYLFQTIQISFGCLGFVLCLAYLIIYFMTKLQGSKRVIPIESLDNDIPLPQPILLQPKSAISKKLLNATPQPIISAKSRSSSRTPQPEPGEIPWNPNKN